MMDLFPTNTQITLCRAIIYGLEVCELLEDYCDVFISCLGSHSFYVMLNSSNYVMLNFSKSIPMKKQTHLHLEWPESEQIFS